MPAKVRVLRHIRGKYRCPSCEGHLRTAPMPAQPLAKSFASPGLLAFIVTAKYVDGLPLYRQQQQFGRLGVELSRTTLARWVVGMGELVVPLMNLLHEELLGRAYLLMDETTVQVLKEPGKAPESKSQLWAMMSPGPEPPIVVFVYDPTRSGDVPRRLLAGFCGALHTDGYSGYGPAVREYDLVHLACWAHGRRGFTDVLKSLGLNPKRLPSNPPAKARRALHALQRIRTLYAIERRIRDASPEQRRRVRQAESVPVLDALRAWLDDTLAKVPPSSPLGKAMAYLDNQWAGLVRYCDDGRYGIDTNPRKFHPSVLPRTPQLAVQRYRGRRSGQRPAVLARPVREGERTRALRLPAPGVHRTAPSPVARRRRSAAADSAHPRRPDLNSAPGGAPSPRVNDAVHGALTLR